MTADIEKQSKGGSVANVVGAIVKWILWIILILYCVTLLFPLIWMLLTSLKQGDFEYTAGPFSLPKGLYFENYPAMYGKLFMEFTNEAGEKIRYGFFAMMGSQLFWTTSCALIGTFFTTIVAYIMAKYKFFGREFLYALGIFVMVTPIVGNMPSMMQIRRALGVYDNMFLMILTSPTTPFSGMNFLILYAAFKGIPWDYAEACMLDGGGHWRVLWSIMMPMILPTSAVIFLLGFFGGWSDYSNFMIWMPSYPSISLGMYNVQEAAGTYGASMPQLMAGFTIVIIPTTILYFVTQKLIMNKLNVGGIKG